MSAFALTGVLMPSSLRVYVKTTPVEYSVQWSSRILPVGGAATQPMSGSPYSYVGGKSLSTIKATSRRTRVITTMPAYVAAVNKNDRGVRWLDIRVPLETHHVCL